MYPSRDAVDPRRRPANRGKVRRALQQRSFALRATLPKPRVFGWHMLHQLAQTPDVTLLKLKELTAQACNAAGVRYHSEGKKYGEPGCPGISNYSGENFLAKMVQVGVVAPPANPNGRYRKDEPIYLNLTEEVQSALKAAGII